MPAPSQGSQRASRPGTPAGRVPLVLSSLLALAACAGPQSALDPAGDGAARIAHLFWVMLAGAAVIWILVVGAVVYVRHIRPGPHPERLASALLLWGGLVVPTVVLTALLVWGLALMADLRRPGDGRLEVAVSGEQWWWRVDYRMAGRDAAVSSANDLRLPRGARVELEVSSPDVIHAFWIPSIAGKIDMIPGRVTRLVVEPTRTGAYRGACAEYCGESHALMAFSVEVMEPAAFEQWLAQQAEDAAAPATPLAAQGQELFQQVGCGACHAVRGTAWQGRLGPDLSRVGSRLSLAAGALENHRGTLAGWIAGAQDIKPGNSMPAYGRALGGEDLLALAAWLEGLR
jgi:cytochrome c oxidase subunit II